MKLGWLRKTVNLLIGNLFVFVLLLCLVEGAFFLHYRYLPKNEVWLGAAREYYRSFNADVIQYNQKCAKHDPDLTYTLRPGASCTFENAEFSTRVSVNSMGARDDEESLHAPEVIVLGDSYTMGWGVEHDETFASLLEQALGVKVLNAGQSSYGTARELLYFTRLDRSKLKALVIQYCENDNYENGKYIKDGYKIKNMSRVSYDLIRKQAMKRVAPYRFGNFMRLYWPLTKDVREYLSNQKEKAELIDMALHQKLLNRRDAQRFLRCLAKGPADLKGLPIYVLEINRHNQNDTLFIQAVETLLAHPSKNNPYQDLTVKTLDISPLLHPSDYFVLDDHLKKSGHQIVADVLAGALKEDLGKP